MGITQVQLSNIVEEVKQQLAQINAIGDLNQVRAQYLGKKGQLTTLLKALGQMAPAERAIFGKEVNAAKDEIKLLFNKHGQQLERRQLEAKLLQEAIDVTLPGRGQNVGSLHPVTLVRQRFVKIFSSMGFVLADGPEIEDDYHNFEALNFAPKHPARADHDTFYFSNGLLLRTHTSPVQIRYMESNSPPLRVIAVGKVYRCDYDATHTPMFHQLEGLLVDERATFAGLKSLLNGALEKFFNAKIELRLRPSYFPFTEPSAEVDFRCFVCKGEGCSLCGRTGWIEGIGCGMVHPNVLAAVNIDSEKYTGFAFGIGIDRIAMFYYGINDLRLLFENDLRFLEQF